LMSIIIHKTENASNLVANKSLKPVYVVDVPDYKGSLTKTRGSSEFPLPVWGGGTRNSVIEKLVGFLKGESGPAPQSFYIVDWLGQANCHRKEEVLRGDSISA